MPEDAEKIPALYTQAERRQLLSYRPKKSRKRLTLTPINTTSYRVEDSRGGEQNRIQQTLCRIPRSFIRCGPNGDDHVEMTAPGDGEAGKHLWTAIHLVGAGHEDFLGRTWC